MPPPDNTHRPPRPAEPPEEENRDFVNLVAVVFVIALTIGGIWLFKTLQHHGEIGDCIASGRHDCIDLVHPDAPAP